MSLANACAEGSGTREKDGESDMTHMLILVRTRARLSSVHPYFVMPGCEVVEIVRS